MENSEDNEYSREFVDGVISDYMARKKKNTNSADAYNANSKQRVYRIAGANPGAAPANNNRQTAGQDVTTYSDSARRQSNGQTNYNQYSDNNPVNNSSVSPILLCSSKDPKLPADCINATYAPTYDEAETQCMQCSRDNRVPGDVTSMGIYYPVCMTIWCKNHPNTNTAECGEYNNK